MTNEELNKICEWLDTNITCMDDNTRMFFIERFRKAMDAVVKEPLTWHKVSEELPAYNIAVLVAYDKCNWDMCFNHRSNNPDVKTTKNGWCEVGFDGEPTHWMYIPELPKED